MRPDGTVYGEGQGIVMGKSGEIAAWIGQGVGTFKKDGAVSYRGAIYYQTTVPAWQRLNSVACVFEYESTRRAQRTPRSGSGSSDTSP